MASSRMLEGYCADIEHLLRERLLRNAVRLAVALPDICAALAHPSMQSSCESYGQWCLEWLHAEHPSEKGDIGRRLFRLHARSLSQAGAAASEAGPSAPLLRLRMRRNSRVRPSSGTRQLSAPHGRLEAFQMRLCESLVEAARNWYRDHGRHDQTVQMNIGKLLVTR